MNLREKSKAIQYNIETLLKIPESIPTPPKNNKQKTLTLQDSEQQDQTPKNQQQVQEEKVKIETGESILVHNQPKIEQNLQQQEQKVQPLQQNSEKPQKNVQAFKCQYCQRGFTESFNLRHHIKTIHKENPYKCKWCDGSFLFFRVYKQHAQEVHKQTVKINENGDSSLSEKRMAKIKEKLREKQEQNKIFQNQEQEKIKLNKIKNFTPAYNEKDIIDIDYLVKEKKMILQQNNRFLIRSKFNLGSSQDSYEIRKQEDMKSLHNKQRTTIQGMHIMKTNFWLTGYYLN